MDRFLRLTLDFCLQRSSPARASSTQTCVYTVSQARLGGPIFTPRCFPKKTLLQRPLSPKVHHTKTIHTALCSCCRVACFSTSLIIMTLWDIMAKALHDISLQCISHIFPPGSRGALEQIFSVSYLNLQTLQESLGSGWCVAGWEILKNCYSSGGCCFFLRQTGVGMSQRDPPLPAQGSRASAFCWKHRVNCRWRTQRRPEAENSCSQETRPWK